MISTKCKECIYSDKISSNKPCSLNIIESIKASKKINVIDEYNVIENYQCRYGFSKKIYDENKQNIKDIDLINYIKHKNLIKYYLVIDFISDKNYCPNTLYESINALSIKPEYISILIQQSNPQKLIDNCNLFLDKSLKWKIHNFLDEDMGIDNAIKVALDTNKVLEKTQFLWINSASDMRYIIENNAIEKINFIANILQPTCNFIRSSVLTSDYPNNLFLSKQTYSHIVKQIDSNLTKGILSLKDTTIVNYD